MILPLLFALACAPSPLEVVPAQDLSPAQRRVLDAIRAIESGGQERPPDGQGGRHIGPFQISLAYWTDAAGGDASLRNGRYSDCRDRSYAERVVAAYMRRYCLRAWERGDAEVIARTHAGGPRGADRRSTLAYWARVRAILEAGPPR